MIEDQRSDRGRRLGTPGPWFYVTGAVWTTPGGPDDGGVCVAKRDGESAILPTEQGSIFCDKCDDRLEHEPTVIEEEYGPSEATWKGANSTSPTPSSQPCEPNSGKRSEMISPRRQTSMAATIARAQGIHQNHSTAQVTRLGSEAARTEANTWRTIARTTTTKRGTGEFSLQRDGHFVAGIAYSGEPYSAAPTYTDLVITLGRGEGITIMHLRVEPNGRVLIGPQTLEKLGSVAGEVAHA